MKLSPEPDSEHSRSFICLMYHNVSADPGSHNSLGASITSYFVDKKKFATQLAQIEESKGWFLNSDQMRSFFSETSNNSNTPWPLGYPVLLSFDDGWQDSVEVAGPILEAHSCQAYLFVTTEFVNKPFFVNQRHLQNLPTNQFQLGSHGRTHRLLCLLSDQEIRAELEDSKAFLEDVGGFGIDSLSVPGGALDHRVLRIAGEVGYRYLFTSEIHVNSRQSGPMDIGRLPIKRSTSLSALNRFVQQRIARERIRRSLLGGPKRLLGLARYEKLRRFVLGQSQTYP